MIIRLNSEANLVKATEVKLIKTSDYQDTLTFKLPLDEKIFVDELIGVRTKVMKQDYRVKEIITKDRFKDVYCEHKFFDCKNIIIPFVDEAHRAGESYNDFSRYNSLQSIVAHLNRIMRTKGDTEFKFSTDIDKSGVVECDDTPLFDLIFGEKGILKTFNVELVYDNYKVKFVEKRPSKNTEILFHESKNVSELQETVDFKGIVTKLHVTCKYTPDKTEEGKAERERLRAEKRRELFNKSQEKIRAREERQAQERALRRQKQEEAYQASRTAPKKTREQIHAEHLQKQQDTENRILANNAARRQAREQKFNEREQQRVSRAQDKDDLIFRTVFVSPLVNRYARPYEASLNFQSSEINSEAALLAWCNANLFTDEDTRDVPLRNFSFKPAEDDYNVDINDRAMVNFTSIGTTKIVHCCKIEYDALHDKYLNIEFGVLNKSAIRETIGNLNSKISETNSNISRTYDILDKNFDDYVQKELEAYSELYYIDKGEIEDTINQGFEDAKIEAEKVYGNINTDIENKLAPIREEVRTTVDAYNQQLEATKKELEQNRAASLEQLKELSSRVNNIQDISTNPTVLELKQQVAEVKESESTVKSKVTELEGSITREFSSIKSKTENDLNVVKSEFTKGVDGLTRKVSSLEEYKNQDGSRTESLKQWVQRDTASQLSRERTEITRIVDSKGYVKNTEFSSKFNDNAQGINRKLDALETYKNQDGTRTSALKQWTQDNTANQLATERRSIESWVDNKGYITTSVLNNKVQETANSFSREISNVRESIPTSVGGRNYILNSEKLTNINAYGTNWEKTVENGTLVFTKVRATESTGMWMQIMEFLKDNFQNEVLTWSVDVKASKNISFNNVGQETNGFKGRVDITTQWQRISHTFTNRFTRWFSFVFYEMVGTCSPGDKIYIRLPKLEKGNIATDWTPAPEDDQQSINDLNSWKQTTTGTLNTVTNTLNDTVRHSQLQITADSINFGSNKVFNGRNLASMLSVSPDSIKAITDRLIISPANENLVLPEYRDTANSNSRDLWLTPKLNVDDISVGEEYIFKGGIFPTNGAAPHNINFILEYKSTRYGTNWITSRISNANTYPIGIDYTLRINVGITDIEYIRLGIQQEAFSNFKPLTIYNAQIYKKKSAELIVDGTIEGKHIKSSTIETGHLKAGSVTANIVAADAIKATHLNVDDAMIEKLVANKAFVNKLWANQAFVQNLNAIKVSTVDLSSYRGRIGNFNIGQHWGGSGQWITGLNNFSVGMSDGSWDRTALWVNWGDNWSQAGNKAWYVTPDGRMRCYNKAEFWNEPIVYGNLKVTGDIIYDGGRWCYSKIYTELGKADGNSTRLFLRGGNGLYDYIVIDSLVSDRRLKHNIEKSKVNALEVLNKFETYSFTRTYREDVKDIELGIMAQDVKEYMHDAFVEHPAGYYTYEPFEMIPYLIKGIQELSTQNKELQNRISKLEEEING